MVGSSLGGSGLMFSFWMASTISIGFGGGGGGGSGFNLRSLSGDNATAFHFFIPFTEIYKKVRKCRFRDLLRVQDGLKIRDHLTIILMPIRRSSITARVQNGTLVCRVCMLELSFIIREVNWHRHWFTRIHWKHGLRITLPIYVFLVHVRCIQCIVVQIVQLVAMRWDCGKTIKT